MILRLAFSALLALALTAAPGCKHPYSGRPERLKKPRPKKPKEKKEEDDAPVVGTLDTKCRTNFFADPDPPPRRRTREARSLATQADKLLVEAEQSESTDERIPVVADALDRLRSALDKDPYAPLPTYKMAVAYALVGKKGCAISLLERLKALQDYPPVEDEARRTVKRAVRDLAFDAFRSDARTALGE